MADAARAPSEWKLGWGQLIVALLGVTLGCHAIFQFSLGLFIKPLQDTFGWTRAEVSAMSSIFSLVLAFVTPVYGILIDRLGVRIAAAFSSVCLALGFWALSGLAGNLQHFYLIIFLTALFGGGTVTMAYIRLIGGWFDRSRGFAIGITAAGTGVAALILPPLLGGYISSHGWRAGYQLLAVMAALNLPLMLLFVRDRQTIPEMAENIPIAAGLTLREAIRTGRFWLLGLTFCVAGAAVTGLVVHFVPMLQGAGLTLPQAGKIAGSIGLAIVIARLTTGFLCDRVFAPFVAAGVFFLTALGALAFLLLGRDAAMFCALMIGLGLGAEIDLVGYMSARYFGLRSYGSIIGIQYGLFALGAAVAPIANGLLFDHFGSYKFPLIITIVLLLLTIPAILSLGRYPDHHE